MPRSKHLIRWLATCPATAGRRNERFLQRIVVGEARATQRASEGARQARRVARARTRGPPNGARQPCLPIYVAVLDTSTQPTVQYER